MKEWEGNDVRYGKVWSVVGGTGHLAESAHSRGLNCTGAGDSSWFPGDTGGANPGRSLVSHWKVVRVCVKFLGLICITVCVCMHVSFLQSSRACVSCGVRAEKQISWPCPSYCGIRDAQGTAGRSWDTPPWLTAGDSSSFCRFNRPLLLGQIKPCSSISSNHPLLLVNQRGGGWPMLRKTGKVLWNRGCTDIQAGWG